MFIKKIVPRRIKTIKTQYRYIFSQLPKNHINNFKKLINKDSLSIDDEDNWLRKFNKSTFSNHRNKEIAEIFFSCNIEVIKDLEVLPTDIIAICVEKNEITKIKRFINYHRKLGIDKFIILDNNSTDGTIEYLLRQKDVIIMQDKTPYTSNRRIAWINRIIAHYGYNRWYFVADADELLAYNDCENKSIKDLIKYCEENKIIRLQALLLDMYAKPDYYINGNANKYYEECIYFDIDTYKRVPENRFKKYIGGPRERIFKNFYSLTKYPLVYIRKKDIYIDSHHLYPFEDNFKSDCNVVLKHYKFLPTEFDRIKQIAEEGNYFNKSFDYKNYMKVINKNKRLDFFYENTNKYKNSKSLNKIEIYKKINWN